MLVQFFFTSHLVLQACCQWANELVGLSMELRHLQYWSEGTSSEELLLWMQSHHWGKVLPPLAPVSIYTNCYLFTCIFVVGKSVPPHSCFAGLVSSGGATSQGQGRAHVARSPPHIGACANSRDIIGEGAPGDQPPATSEEVQTAPTPNPKVSTLQHYFTGTLPLHSTVQKPC